MNEPQKSGCEACQKILQSAENQITAIKRGVKGIYTCKKCKTIHLLIDNKEEPPKRKPISNKKKRTGQGCPAALS